MLRMVIFDFDGVIADSEPAHYQVFHKVLQDIQIELTWPQYCDKYLGYDDRECFAHVLGDKGRNPLPTLVTELARKKQRLFAEYLQHHQVIMPGIPELLQNLKTHKVICSICSGALRSEIELMLRQGNLQPFFTVIIGADDVTAGKPDPQGYLLSLSRTNEQLGNHPIKPTECVVIEDSVWGIQAAKKAQMHCLAIATSYPPEQLTRADQVVQNLTEVNAQRLEQLTT